MLKLLRLLLVLLVVLVVGVVVAGYVAGTRIEARTELVLDAPPEQIFAAIAHLPSRAQWFGQEFGTGIARVEVVDPRALATVVAAGGSEEAVAQLGPTVTHRYVLEDGSVQGAQLTAYEPGRLIAERLLEMDPGIGGLFESLAWRFEVAPAPTDPRRSRVVFLTHGVARRPIGAFLNALMEAVGARTQEHRAMAASCEQLARARGEVLVAEPPLGVLEAAAPARPTASGAGEETGAAAPVSPDGGATEGEAAPLPAGASSGAGEGR
ncbi:MAG: hypothetical protein KatS3mg102_0514 [Planctomycetota bacterium]|nr:MAG: hypothetical protein KatS3mg102_0514 [Planctomycetota bacterium]